MIFKTFNLKRKITKGQISPYKTIYNTNPIKIVSLLKGKGLIAPLFLNSLILIVLYELNYGAKPEMLSKRKTL